jgi:Kef-type K+ transport system membrane component KefB
MLLLILLQATVLFVVGFAGCWLSHRLGWPRVVGGLLAGILLGPSVLGQLDQGLYRKIFLGGEIQYGILERYMENRENKRQTLVETGVTEAALEEFDETTRTTSDRMAEGVPSTDTDQQRATVLIFGPAMSVVLMTGALAIPLRSSRLALGAGTCAAAMACLGGWIVMDRAAPTEPALWLAGLAIGCAAMTAPLALTLMDRFVGSSLLIDDEQLRPQREVWMASLPGLILSLMAATAITGTVSTGHLGDITFDPTLWFWMNLIVAAGCPIAALAVCSPATHWSVRVLTGTVISMVILFMVYTGGTWTTGAVGAMSVGILLAGAIGTRDEMGQPHPWDALLWIFEPVVLAIAGMSVRIESVDWAVLLVAVVAFGDGKALGALIPMRLMRNYSWTASLLGSATLASGGAGTAIVALLLLQAQVITEGVYAALILASILTTILIVPTMRLIDRQVVAEMMGGRE